jgi:hypothetical protein
MLDFALQYWVAIDDVTSSKTAGLHRYELNDEEWGIAHHLCNSLKVCLLFPIWHFVSHMHGTVAGFQRCDIILLAFNTEPCYHHSSNGSY